MKTLIFVMALHVKGEITPRRIIQLVQHEEQAALMLYEQQKQTPFGASLTGELFEVDLLDRVITKKAIPVVKFEHIEGKA